MVLNAPAPGWVDKVLHRAGSSHDSTVRATLVAWRVKSLLVGRSADPEIQQAIDEIICSQEGVERALNIITIQFGPDTMLAAKLKFDGAMNINDAVACINELERELKARIAKLKWCFIEPDIAD